MIMVYMNVLQFDMCSNCYALVYWLPTYWEIYEVQYLGYLLVRRYYSVNSFSTAYPVAFQMSLLMPHIMHRIHACCSGVLWVHLYHRALELWETTATQMRIVERGLHLSDAVSSRLIATQRRSSIVARSWSFEPGDCWFVIELIICYIFHRYLILSSLSQVILIIYNGLWHRYNLCAYIPW